MAKLSPQEESTLYELIEEITGTCQKGHFKKDVLLTNIERRMGGLGISSFPAYLVKLSEDDKEYDHFISLTTIHTTFWFREEPHFDLLEKEILERLKKENRVHYRVWTSACSSGQEAYSIALVLEKICHSCPTFSYEVFASDIDPISVEKARTGFYPETEAKTIPAQYQHFLISTGSKGYQVNDHIRKKMRFFQGSLTEDQSSHFSGPLDMIFCRNVLIYFSPQDTLDIIKIFERCLSTNGLLVLGHSENFDTHGTHFKIGRNSSFRIVKTIADKRPVQETTGLKLSFQNPQLIAIGASTGGPETLDKFLRNFPSQTPPVVVVQHINDRYSESFARRMAQASGLECADTTKKNLLRPGVLYMPHGDYHLMIVEEGHEFYIQPSLEPQRFGHRASVDVLFESIARTRARAIGVLLTGMGRDGAQGLLQMHKNGRCLTMAQDEASSVVFGMPKAAIELGAANIIGSDDYLSRSVRDFIVKKSSYKRSV